MFKFFYPQRGSNILVYNNIAKNNHVIVFLNKNQHQLLKATSIIKSVYIYIYTSDKSKKFETINLIIQFGNSIIK